MSWDVLILRIPVDVDKIEGLPVDFKPPVIGSRAEVALSIRALFPEAIISNLSWLVIHGDGFSIEVSTGRDDACRGFTLHVRGGDGATEAVMMIARHFEARAFDLTSCEFLDRMSDPGSGFRQWRAYRNKVIGDSE
jgi:hypothetical protein